MNPWYDTDHLQPERMGVNRNVFFGTLGLTLVLWQIAEAVMKMNFGEEYTDNALLSSLPLLGSAAFWYFFLIPNIRRWNDRHPPGHFQGLSDFYFSNPEHLEVANDPEPLPLFVRAAPSPEPGAP